MQARPGGRSAGVTQAATRLKGVARAAEDEKCAAYRQQFLLG
jgi:hypothetical protein